ncbi:ribosomal protein L7/L12 [Microbacterium resistens]|uniref:Ribosomal protein L7/L12 n=1 Tax=Microbacterium resistens TaxID=156977 RepID=A0ABU1SH50_9MICO|nr:hypothetical protein [Microbacterium resistens]MDR6868929.1 ribosomal protein L7/L12 [Microbacterium resistens]
MEILWIIGIVAGVVVLGLFLGAVVRSVRPRAPMPMRLETSVSVPPQVTAEVDRLVAGGHRAAATRLLRRHTGLGPSDAKDRIEHWSASTVGPHAAAISYTTPTRSAVPVAYSAGSVRSALPATVASDIDKLLAGGAKPIAISVLRRHTGLGPAEAKEQIDAWMSGPRT